MVAKKAPGTKAIKVMSTFDPDVLAAIDKFLFLQWPMFSSDKMSRSEFLAMAALSFIDNRKDNRKSDFQKWETIMQTFLREQAGGTK